MPESPRFARQAGYRKITLWTNDVLTAGRGLYQKKGYQLLKEGNFHAFATTSSSRRGSWISDRPYTGTLSRGGSDMRMRAIALNVVALALFWGVAFVFVQFAQRVPGGWPATGVAEVAGAGLAVWMALRLRAVVAAFVIAGQLAFATAELAIHAVYGIRAAQGAATHFAVMLAGTLGVLFGVLLMRMRKPATA